MKMRRALVNYRKRVFVGLPTDVLRSVGYDKEKNRYVDISTDDKTKTIRMKLVGEEK